jgi:hypothetical protein
MWRSPDGSSHLMRAKRLGGLSVRLRTVLELRRKWVLESAHRFVTCRVLGDFPLPELQTLRAAEAALSFAGGGTFEAPQ